MSKKIEEYTVDELDAFVRKNADMFLLVDADADTYKTLLKNNPLFDFVEEAGSYADLVQKLWFHRSKDQEAVSEDYQVFVPTFGKFSGKYGKRLKIVENDTPHAVQMTYIPSREIFILSCSTNSITANICVNS